MRTYFTFDDGSAGGPKDKLLNAHPTSTVEELLVALGVEATASGGWQVNDVGVAATELVGSAIPDGGILERRTLPGRANPSIGFAIDLAVIGGPDAGRTWTLPPSAYRIGRDPRSDVVLATDLQVSRSHAEITVSEGSVSARDLDSRNGILVGGERVYGTEIAEDSPFQMGETVLSWKRHAGVATLPLLDGEGHRILSRPPRIRPDPEVHSVALPASPAEKSRIAFPLIGVLAPLAVGVLMAVVLKRPEFLLFTALSPVMAASNFITSRRQGRHSNRSAAEAYEIQMAAAEKSIEQAVEAEELRLRDDLPDPATVARNALGMNPRLWERRPADSDFLELRVGLVDRDASCELLAPRSHQAQDPNLPRAPLLHRVPTSVGLGDCGVLGLAGAGDSPRELARWLVVQAAALHSPDDLSLSVLCDQSHIGDWAWARWLPHLRSDLSESVARLAADDLSVSELAGRLAAVVDDRLQMAQKIDSRSNTADPAIVVLLDNAHLLGGLTPLTKVLRHGPSVRVFSICIDSDERLLPEECRASLVFPAGSPTRLTSKSTGLPPVSDILADLVGVRWAESVARALAPLRLNRRRESTATIPSELRLLDLASIEPPTPEAVARKWAGGGRTTAAVIGRTADDDLVLDLARHGPHGLVAGTTGSGKSELLQTIISSLAIANRPDTMSFVLVDYKGGSAFKDCAKLPHTVGIVTDLDGHLTERALESLAAELRRRERIFSESGVKDLEDYQRLLDNSAKTQSLGDDVPEQLGRFVIVIDEFASLVEELPSFVSGLVDIARRGRSLGIHLILATQRPSGVVSPAIKTNTNMRIAMRVTDSADSMDIINSAVAAKIEKDKPGRAFLRVGHEQLTEFQAGRVGGLRSSVAADRSLDVIDIPISSLSAELPAPVETDLGSDETDLSLLVDAITKATRDLDLPLPPQPWMAPLPDLVVLDDLVEDDDRHLGSSLQVAYGIEDHPSSQSQTVAVYDLERAGHAIFIGDPASGRSTVLRTLLGSIATHVDPTDLFVYALDCGSGALLPAEELPHCAAAVSRLETERVDRLFSRLNGEISARQEILSGGGFSSIADQRNASEPRDRLPYLLLLIDRWEGFVASFEAVDNGRLVAQVLHLMREGLGAGLKVVITGDRSALTTRLSSLAEQILMLKLNDRATYSTAGLNPKNLPDRIGPGRAFRSNGATEIQIALLDEDPSGPAQAKALSQLAARASDRFKDADERRLAKRIGVMPQMVSLTQEMLLTPQARDAESASESVLIGVGGDSISLLRVPVTELSGGFIIAGPRSSGRSNSLLVIARSAVALGYEIVGVTARNSPLSEMAGTSGVIGVVEGQNIAPSDLTGMIESAGLPVIVLVDDAELLADSPISEPLAAFLRSARDRGNGLVLAGTTTSLGSGFKGFIPEARRAKTGLLLCPASTIEGDLYGIRLQRSGLFSAPPGRGHLISNGEVILAQVPLA